MDYWSSVIRVFGRLRGLLEEQAGEKMEGGGSLREDKSSDDA